MLNSILRIFTDIIYLVPFKIRNFKKNNPDIQVLVAGATKARKMKSDSTPEYEQGWATARRSILLLATNGFHCGDWFIPLANVKDVKLHRITGGLLLKVSTNDDSFYQFGLQVNPAWEKQTVLPMRAEQIALKFSSFSIILRIILIAFFIWVIIRDYIMQQVSSSTFLYILLVIWIILPISKFLLSKRKQ